MKQNGSPVTLINYWQDCDEGVECLWYIGSDIWFHDDFRKASSHGFQSIFSKGWYLGEVLSRIPYRSLFERCFRGFVLPVVDYRSELWYSATDTHIKLLYTIRVISGDRFLTDGVFECNIIIIIIIKKCQQCKAGREWYTPYQSEHPSPTIPTPEAPTLWRSTCALCASPGYTQCFDRTSV